MEFTKLEHLRLFDQNNREQVNILYEEIKNYAELLLIPILMFNLIR